MAVDDVTIVLTANMAQNDTTDRQPGAGVEEMALDIADFDATGGLIIVDIYMIDGTNNDTQVLQANANVWWKQKMIADNTNYFRFEKRHSTQSDYGFSVIQIG